LANPREIAVSRRVAVCRRLLDFLGEPLPEGTTHHHLPYHEREAAGLMIAALAKGAGAFHEPAYEEAARRAAGFILARMRDPGGRLLHRYRNGEAAIPAFLDDYAFLIWGLVEVFIRRFTLEERLLFCVRLVFVLG